MEVSFAFLCDHAEQSAKLTAVGIGFDTIHATQVPTVHPSFFAVIALRFSRLEAGQKRIRMHLQDADGKDVVPPLNVTIEVREPAPTYTHSTHRIALGFQMVRFSAYGDYQITFLVDEMEATTLPLKVAPPPAGQPTTPS